MDPSFEFWCAIGGGIFYGLGIFGVVLNMEPEERKRCGEEAIKLTLWGVIVLVGLVLLFFGPSYNVD